MNGSDIVVGDRSTPLKHLSTYKSDSLMGLFLTSASPTTVPSLSSFPSVMFNIPALKKKNSASALEKKVNVNFVIVVQLYYFRGELILFPSQKSPAQHDADAEMIRCWLDLGLIAAVNVVCVVLSLRAGPAA
jgi:hypothetical protein